LIVIRLLSSDGGSEPRGHGADEVRRCRLTVRTRNPDDPEVSRGTNPADDLTCVITERIRRIGDHNLRPPRVHFQLNDEERGSPVDSLACILVSVRVLTAPREEHVARAHLTRVGLSRPGNHLVRGTTAVTKDESTRHRFGYFAECKSNQLS